MIRSLGLLCLLSIACLAGCSVGGAQLTAATVIPIVLGAIIVLDHVLAAIPPERFPPSSTGALVVHLAKAALNAITDLLTEAPPPSKLSDLTRSANKGALMLWLFWATLVTGCAALATQPVALQRAESDALACGSQAVQTEMVSLAPTVLDALAGDSPDWRTQLAGFEKVGSTALVCAVSHALYDALGGDVSAIASTGLERVIVERLMFADIETPPMPSPTRRTLSRGLTYLKEWRARGAK